VTVCFPEELVMVVVCESSGSVVGTSITVVTCLPVGVVSTIVAVLEATGECTVLVSLSEEFFMVGVWVLVGAGVCTVMVCFPEEFVIVVV
jgi:hypothetical protein